MSSWRVAVGNMRVAHDKAANIGKMRELAHAAHVDGAHVLVLPEVALQGYADIGLERDSDAARAQLEYYRATAEEIPGPSTDRLARAAAELDLVIQFGLAELDAETGAIHNSVAVVDRTGLRGSYRKVHNRFEHPYFAPGSAVEPIATSAGLLGPLVCYDLAFPELARSYALQGAELLTVSTAWPMKGHDAADDYYGRMMDLGCAAAAFFNQVPLACSNHCESGAYFSNVDYYGASQVVDQAGLVAGRLGSEEGVLVCDVTPGRADRPPAFFGHDLLEDRRPECYPGVTDLAIGDRV